MLTWTCGLKNRKTSLSDADPGPQDPVLWLQYTNTHGLQKSCAGKGTVRPLSQEESTSEHLGHSLKRRAPWPLPWQAFVVFLGPLHQRWSSFIMHRFVLGGYLLQTTKERMSLNTSKKDICNAKGEVVKPGLCSIPGRSSSDFRKIKMLSKHLLPQFRMREF